MLACNITAPPPPLPAPALPKLPSLIYFFVFNVAIDCEISYMFLSSSSSGSSFPRRSKIQKVGKVLVCGVFIHLHLGFVHPLQDVALHQCLPSSSVCCLPNPGGSLLLCYVILPSSAWSSSRPFPSPWLPLCASPCPPIVL